MLKIYNARNLHGKVQLQDYIEFKYGRFDTGITFGFGEVICSRFNQEPSKKINYEFLSSKKYVELARKFAKLHDGFVTDFCLWNPYSYEELEEKFKNIAKNQEAYERNGLNEEAIILFTDRVYVEYCNDLVQKVFGRWKDTGMYFLEPDAVIDLIPTNGFENKETYEVLQSKSLGKQLVLNKLNRKIK